MPFFLIALLILGATMAFTFLTKKGQKSDRNKPAGLGDFNFPTATEVRPIPVVVGKVKHKAPNCIWYGDLKSEPIYQKVPNPLTFGITKKKVETGQYRYYVGMDLALCHGLVRLREFLIDDKSVWTGDLTFGTIQFDKSDLFGGEKKEGGYAGTFDFYGGTETQTYNPYVQTKNPTKKMPHYRGISHIVQRGASSGGLLSTATQTFNYILNLGGGGLSKVLNGYVGISANLRPYSFILQRNPDHLGQTAYTEINDGDANPIEWLFEVMTNKKYGMGIAPELIYLPAFQAAALVCFNEGLGCSVLWDTSRPCQDVVNDIVNLVDGACFQDRSLGLWVVRLARKDYVDADLFVFNEDNITEFTDFGINTLDEAPNHHIVAYIDKQNGYNERHAEFKNLAQFRNAGGEPIQKDLDFYGVCDPQEAADLAFRESKNDSIPLAKASFKTGRVAHWVRPLSVFKYARPSRGIAPVVMRCMKVDDGKFYDGEISIECLQDINSIQGTATFTPPAPTGWQLPNAGALAVPHSYLTEQPFLFSGDGARLWGFAERAGSNQSFDLFVSEDAGASFAAREQAADFAPVGTLLNAYNATNPVDTSNSLIINFGADMNRLGNVAAADVMRGANLALIADTGEIIGFQTITDNSNGTVTLNNIWRGLLDTVVSKHAAGARIWFFSEGQAFPEENYALSQNLSVKFLPNSPNGQLPLSAAAAVPITITARSLRPLPPALFSIAGTFLNQSIPSPGADIAFLWRNRNRLLQANVLKQDDPALIPETGQTVTIEVRKGSDNSLLNTYEGIAGSSFVYTAAMQTTDAAASENQINFVIYSTRGEVNSFQAVRLNTARAGSGESPAPDSPPYDPNTDFPSPPVDSPTSLGGIEIEGAPDATHVFLKYNPDINKLIWVEGGIGGGLTVEQIQDMIAVFLVDQNNQPFSYDDLANKLKIVLTSGGRVALVDGCGFICENGQILYDD